LSNLLTNAAKYSNAGVRSNSSLLWKRARCVLPSEMRHRYSARVAGSNFDMFSQVDAAQLLRWGLGIGLALVKDWWSARRNRRGEKCRDRPGSEFTCTCPRRHSPRPMRLSRLARHRRIADRRRVLIADDNKDAAIVGDSTANGRSRVRVVYNVARRWPLPSRFVLMWHCWISACRN